MSVNSGLLLDPNAPQDTELDFVSNDHLTGVVFLYTAGVNNEWIYSIRGDGETGFFVNKLK